MYEKLETKDSCGMYGVMLSVRTVDGGGDVRGGAKSYFGPADC
jgi:hypothetical protein